MKNLTEKIKGLIQKFCTKEVILYAVFGVLTTIINWGTFAILTKAFSNLDKNVANAIAIIAAVLVAYITNKDLVFHSEAKGFNEKFKEFLSNDLNTSNALTLLYDLIKDTNVSSNTKLKLIKSWDSVLSLDLIKEKNIDEELLNKINELIEKRNIAKENRDYALADQIRDELKNMNVVIKDTKEGTTFEIL